MSFFCLFFGHFSPFFTKGVIESNLSRGDSSRVAAFQSDKRRIIIESNNALVVKRKRCFSPSSSSSSSHSSSFRSHPKERISSSVKPTHKKGERRRPKSNKEKKEKERPRLFFFVPFVRARVFQAFDDGRVRALPEADGERRCRERTRGERGGGREPFQGVSECHLRLLLKVRWCAVFLTMVLNKKDARFD